MSEECAPVRVTQRVGSMMFYIIIHTQEKEALLLYFVRCKRRETRDMGKITGAKSEKTTDLSSRTHDIIKTQKDKSGLSEKNKRRTEKWNRWKSFCRLQVGFVGYIGNFYREVSEKIECKKSGRASNRNL